jgi:hypothetical protein
MRSVFALERICAEEKRAVIRSGMEKKGTAQNSRRMRLPSWDVRRISYVMILVYILTLIPLLIIGQYDYPSADDYTMGLGTRLIYEETGSILAVLQKVLHETLRYYRTWTGYFTSCLFTVVNPSTFGESWYVMTPVIILTGLHAGVIAFFYVLMEKVLGMDRYLRRCITVLVLFLMIQMMPEGGLRAEAFYWYSGAGNYTLTFSLGLLYLSCYFLEILEERGRRKLLLPAAVLGFFAGGGNYLTALFCAIVSVMLCLWIAHSLCREETVFDSSEENSDGKKGTEGSACRKRKKFAAEAVPKMLPAAGFLMGFALNCLAPGNQVRGSVTTGYGAVKAILLSLYYTLSYPLNQWMNWAVLMILVAAGIFYWIGSCRKKSEPRVRFDRPLTASVLAYGLVSAVVTPALYAQGNIGAGRIQSTFWLHYVLVLLILEWYLVGALHRMWSKSASNRESLVRSSFQRNADDGKNGDGQTLMLRVMRAGIVLFLVFSGLTVKGNPYFYTFTSAAEDLLNGSARTYGEENAQRQEQLTDDKEQDAVLQRYTAWPELLYYMDISEDSEDWVNQKLCEYYHKNSVRGTVSKE